MSLPQIAAIALYPPHSSTHFQVQYAPKLQLTSSQDIRDKVDASRAVIDDKVARGISIYGISTGFGGSADTRTGDPIALGAALLQHHHVGVILPSSVNPSLGGAGPMPLTDPSHGSTMPIPWVRAAMLVRANSLIRGHSGIRWSLVEKMVELIQKGVVPVVPLRGSISASGGELLTSSLNAYLMAYKCLCTDLTPLSYIAGTLIGNPAIRAWVLAPASPSLFSTDLPSTALSVPVSDRPTSIVRPSSHTCPDVPFLDTTSSVSGTSSVSFSPRSRTPLTPITPTSSVLDEEDCIKPFSSNGSHRSTYGYTHSTLLSTAEAMPAPRALQATGTTPLPLASKEHLGIMNGTAFSAGLAALVVRNAEMIVILSAVRCLGCSFKVGPLKVIVFVDFDCHVG